MKITHAYSGKSFKLTPFTTKQEKEILLLSMFDEINFDDVLELCGVDIETIKSLTYDEKKAMLLKLRVISVGDELSVRHTCASCKAVFDGVAKIDGVITEPQEINENITDKFKKFNGDVSDYLEQSIDEFDYNEYEALTKDFDKYITNFNFRYPVTCIRCGHTNYLTIDIDDKTLVDFMSNETISSLYKSFSDLMYFTKVSLADIESMLPFEREIMINLFSKTVEEQNKARGV